MNNADFLGVEEMLVEVEELFELLGVDLLLVEVEDLFVVMGVMLLFVYVDDLFELLGVDDVDDLFELLGVDEQLVDFLRFLSARSANSKSTSSNPGCLFDICVVF